jgi:hypothetical protein
VSIPPFGRGFLRHWVFRSDVILEERETNSRARDHRLDEPPSYPWARGPRSGFDLPPARPPIASPFPRRIRYAGTDLSEEAAYRQRRGYQQIVAQQPAQATYRYHLGPAYAQKGEKQKAIQELQTALKSNPQKDEETQIRQLPLKL